MGREGKRGRGREGRGRQGTGEGRGVSQKENTGYGPVPLPQLYLPSRAPKHTKHKYISIMATMDITI